jgi:hypothetical protein
VSRLMLSGLPEAPPGQHWCAVCVGDYKWAVVHTPATFDRIKEILAGPNDKLGVVAPDRKSLHEYPPLQLAVTMAPVEGFGMHVVAVCWTHAPAIDPHPSNADVPAAFRHNRIIPGMS